MIPTHFRRGKSILAGLIALGAASACQVSGDQSDLPHLTLSVSAALAIPTQALIDAYEAISSQGNPITLAITPAGDPTSAPENGSADAVIDWREPDPTNWSARIGWTGIVFIVHPENPVSDIPSEKARKIFQGEIFRWEDLGAFTENIQPVSFASDSDEGYLFIGLFLRGSRLAPGAVIVPNSAAATQIIAADRYSIGFVLGYQSSDGTKRLLIDSTAPDYPGYLSGRYPFRVPIYIEAPGPVPEALIQFAGWAQSVSGQTVLLELHSRE
jgi:hypothetical protein